MDYQKQLGGRKPHGERMGVAFSPATLPVGTLTVPITTYERAENRKPDRDRQL